MMMKTTPLKLFISLLLFSAAACGGGSDEIAFSGTLVQDDAVARSGRSPAIGLQVCALGQCSITDGLGNWAFSVGDDTFEGGDVVFTVEGLDFISTAVVPNLNRQSDEVFVSFLLDANLQLTAIGVSEVDSDTFGDELNELGEEIEDENDSADQSIEEESTSAADSIDEEIEEI